MSDLANGQSGHYLKAERPKHNEPEEKISKVEDDEGIEKWATDYPFYKLKMLYN